MKTITEENLYTLVKAGKIGVGQYHNLRNLLHDGFDIYPFVVGKIDFATSSKIETLVRQDKTREAIYLFADNVSFLS